MSLFETFQNPPREYSLIPFWFLNDVLEEKELKRQLDDFEAHGVYGIVPHPRIGLPEDTGWLSDRWFHFLRLIVDHCAEKRMQVILYDEGMYPSGSAAGQVVAGNPRHAARCLERRTAGLLDEDEELVAEDGVYRYVHCRSLGTIRGVHFGMDDGEPGAPAAGDILNPEAMASFLHLTHDKHHEHLGDHFGKTVTAIFTDEPSMLGRGGRRGVKSWTWGYGAFLEAYLGYDLRPHLAALWDDAYPQAGRYRRDFERAANARLEMSYYQPYQAWCATHGIALTGHPSGPMDIGTLKYFQLPGQDIVWRYIEPFQDKSLEGEQSTMAKCSASAQVHYGRKRNLNECFGAYGWNFTYEEMRWVTNWLLVRGVNMISPHAFYYSVREQRRDERPPDVGPNNTWWDSYKTYADYVRRISWVLAEGKHVCRCAILGSPTHLPWRVARVLFEGPEDFNYLDTETLLTRAKAAPEGLSIEEMRYDALLLDGPEDVSASILAFLKPMIDAGRVAAYKDPVAGVPAVHGTPEQVFAWLRGLYPPDITLEPPSLHLRFHHARHDGGDFYFFTNEGRDPIEAALAVGTSGNAQWWDVEGASKDLNSDPRLLRLAPYASALLFVARPESA